MKDFAEFNMYREIHEIPQAIQRIKKVFSASSFIDEIKHSDEVIILGTGTSFHAGLLGASWLRSIGMNASCYLASEWTYFPIEHGKTPFYILISQSGETGDILASFKSIHGKTLAITNNEKSPLALKADFSLFLNAGEEKAIAATKTYVSTCIALFALKRVLSGKPFEEDVDGFEEQVEKLFFLEKRIALLAENYKGIKGAYVIGRGNDFFASKEAALKLKETSGLHSEAYQAGELKHGPISLVDDSFVTFAILNEEKTAQVMRCNIEDIKKKGGKVFVFSSNSVLKPDDEMILPSVAEELKPVLSVISFELLALFLAYNLNKDIDNPRLLEKAVKGE